MSRRDRVLADLDEIIGAEPNGRTPLVRTASQVTPEKIEWLWYGRLARGKISLLEGDPGLGKSTLTLEMAARLSTGRPLPGQRALPATGTLFLSAEDGVADTIVPRLIAAGANLDLIHILEGIHTPQGDDGVQIPRDLDLIEQEMTARGSSLVVVDPLSVFLGDNISENRNQEVRKALAPAKAMFERAGVSGLLLRHLTKSQSANPVYRGAGSIGLGGAARVVMMVAEDPDTPGLRVLANVKENLSRPTPSLSYQVISNQEDPEVGQIAWLGESQWLAKDLQIPVEFDDDDDLSPKLADAVEWLLDYLRDDQIVASKIVVRDAERAGIKPKTLKSARKQLGVIAAKNGHGGWGVKLPPAQRPLPMPGPLAQNEQGGPRLGEQGGPPSRAITDFGPLAPLPQNPDNNNKNIQGLLASSLAPLEGPLAKGANEDPRGQGGPHVGDKAPWEES